MTEITQYTPGNFCWVELGTSNQDAAKRFYTELFGWSFTDTPLGPGMGSYTMLKLRGQDVGGLYALNKEQSAQGIPPHWMSYVSVQSADEAVKKAESAGGKALKGAFDVMDAGRMAVLQDPTGATFSLWQPRKHSGARITREPGSFCWNELMTGNVEKARKFYTTLFGWGTQEMPMPEMTYTIFTSGEKQLAGMMPILPRMGNVPANWLVYFAVDNCDAQVDRATRMGGRTHVPPTDIPNVGRFAALSDPQGAAFAVIKLTIPSPS